MNDKFCIRRLNVEFKKISDDQYSVIDFSEYDFNNIDDLLVETIEIKVETPSNEVFSILLPAGRSQIFSVKAKNVIPLVDGKYCISAESCGGIVRKNVGYYPVMKSKIDSLILTTKDKQYMHLLYEEFNLMKILDEHGDTKSAQRIYQDISDMLERCRSGKKCMG